MVVVALGTPAAMADIVLSIQPNTPNPMPGDVGDSFDVLFTNTGLSEVDIAGFEFAVFTTDTDISFTEADASAIVYPYIFAGDSFTVDYLGGVTSIASPATLPPLPGQEILAIDTTNDATNVAVGAGDTTDLGTVLFNVAPTVSSQSFTVSFDTTLAPVSAGGYLYNNFSDANGDAIAPDSFVSADFDIGTAPEPSPLILLPIGLACLWIFGRRRRVATPRAHRPTDPRASAG